MSEAAVIDWTLAERVARAVAGNGTGKRSVRRADLQRATRGSVPLVRAYTGLEPRGRLPRPEVIDRREWIEANLESLRAIAEAAERSMAQSLPVPGPLGNALRGAAGLAAGVELGLVSGFLAQRVLGQYDVALIGPARPSRLLFVAPNLAEAERRLQADREPFLRWIALHEATHVVQFGAVPWLRRHIAGIAEELLAGAFRGVEPSELAALARRLVGDPRRIVAVVRRGEWLSPFIGEPRVRQLRRLQATMAVVEGYSEHVMDAIAAELGPDYAELRERMERGRTERSLLELAIARLLGLELKLRQYRVGKRFCDEVVERRGIEALNRVWSEPSALPSASELERPGRWLTRVA